MMPFWVKDWFGATLHWPGAERGAYISLLAFQWINGAVPADVSQLARITGFTEGEFERIWTTVGAKFDANGEGLFNRRLEEHRKDALRLRDRHTLGATLANEKRRAQRDAERRAENGADHDAERTPPSPSPSPSPSAFENKSAERRRSARAGRVPRGTEVDEDFLSFKLEFPMRAGGQPWRLAQNTWNARIHEGIEPEVMIEGAKRYAKFIAETGKDRSEYVMQAKTFLGPEKHFLADWDVPPDAAQAERWSPPADDPVDPP